MTPLARKIMRRIEHGGPLPFGDFMDMALYDAEYGYYRGKPFGKQGDFRTASQMQPVYGALLHQLADRELPGWDCFVDVGAGNGDLAASFPANKYRAVEHGGSLPKTKRAFMFSNELIDALPLDVIVAGEPMRIVVRSGTFAWEKDFERAVALEKRRGEEELLRAAYDSMDEGCYLIVDYGYRRDEWMRFPEGSLMGYRRHQPIADVLLDPGTIDITAHVAWDDLMEAAERCGWRVEWFRSLRSLMLMLPQEVLEGLYSLGPAQFTQLLAAMGESFEALLLRKS
jgi:SAM-dependent MidA family methyltransferase